MPVLDSGPSRARWMRILAGALLAACASTAAVVRRPGGLHVATCDDGAFFVFDKDEVRVSEASQNVLERFPVPAGSGAPILATHDPIGLWTGAVYEKRLVLLAANRNARPMWPELDVGPVVSAAITGERVAIVGARQITVLRLPEGTRIWQAMPSQGLDSIVHAHPLSDDVVLLVGTLGGGIMADAQVVVRRADRSRGDWEFADTRILDLSWVGACASAGDNLFLAGKWEDARRVAGQRQRPLLQRLVVVRLDAKTTVPRVIVKEESFDFDLRVTDAVAGEDLLAVNVGGREVRVFRALGDEAAVAPLWSKTLADRATMSWLSRRRIALISGATIQVEELPAGATSG